MLAYSIFPITTCTNLSKEKLAIFKGINNIIFYLMNLIKKTKEKDWTSLDCTFQQNTQIKKKKIYGLGSPSRSIMYWKDIS